jgi:hypothetical protein
MQNEPKLEFLFRITAELAAPISIGQTHHGNRQLVPMVGGGCDGPYLKAAAMTPSADWVIVRPDGVAELDVRLTVKTNDDATIYITYRGYLSRLPELVERWMAGEDIPRDEYYFATTPYFETSAAKYAWLQNVVTFGIGELVKGGVAYDIYAVGAAVGANPLPQLAAAGAT